MSITDELREFARGCAGGMGGDALCHIADRIDAEHERQCAESWMRGHDAWAAVDRSNEMAEHGWARLPKDADGKYIRVGDVMEWCDPDGEVTVTCEVDAVGVECFFAWDRANGRYAQKRANAYRHHHEPTVEDVLREFGDWYAHTKGGCDEDGIIADYAAKLRLAGEDE